MSTCRVDVIRQEKRKDIHPLLMDDNSEPQQEQATLENYRTGGAQEASHSPQWVINRFSSGGETLIWSEAQVPI